MVNGSTGCADVLSAQFLSYFEGPGSWECITSPDTLIIAQLQPVVHRLPYPLVTPGSQSICCATRACANVTGKTPSDFSLLTSGFWGARAREVCNTAIEAYGPSLRAQASAKTLDRNPPYQNSKAQPQTQKLNGPRSISLREL